MNVHLYSGGGHPAIRTVIEVISQSEQIWEDAAQRAVADPAKTVEQIRSIWIKKVATRGGALHLAGTLQ